MATEKVLAYALTTKNRVKDRLAITNTQFDTVIDRLISAMTDFIEGECNRRFQETVYSNEIYSIYGAYPETIGLKQTPVSNVASVQYRAGLKTTPNWTNFAADDWELLEDGKSGIIKFYGGITRGVNVIRVTYTAGYKIDFPNAGSATHTLPADLSDLAERIVVRVFEKRKAEGKETESFEGGTVSWAPLLDETDRAIIARHRRLPQFV